MKFDDFVKSLPTDVKATGSKPASDAPRTISAMLVDHQGDEVVIDFLGSTYKINKEAIIDIVSSTRPVVTSTQRGHSVDITLSGDAVLRSLTEHRASEFDQQRPFILQQATQIMPTPLGGAYTMRETAWFATRGLGHLSHAVAAPHTLTVTYCNINTPTTCNSTCGTTSPNSEGTQVTDDSQNDDVVNDDVTGDPVPDDQQMDEEFPLL